MIPNAPPADTIFEWTNQTEPPPDLVTVAVSLFNYARFLPDCLDSVAAQRHAAIELVVVDDASTDNESVSVARDWMQGHAERFGRVLLLRHRRNQGLAQTRNTAFEHAHGANVFVLDADNLIYPRAIGRLQQAIEDGGFAAVYTQLELFGAQTGLGLADIWQPEWLRRGNHIDAMALVSAHAWRDVGGYTHMDGGWEDYDFWCKFVEQGFVAGFVPEVLCRYRVHPGSMLRAETSRVYSDLFVEMTLRHPWLALDPMPGSL
jgi:glycosyltransferase involved in cell wall biosynthesis